MKKRILLGLISVFKALYNAVYAVMKLRPMQKKVVMISRQSNSQRPDFEQLGAEIEARDPGVRLVYLCREMGDTPLSSCAIVSICCTAPRSFPPRMCAS